MRWSEINEDIEGYNLQAKYDQFNRQYFHGELPDIPLSFKPLKSVVGRVLYSFSRKPGAQDTLVPGTLRLELSSLFRRTEENLDGVMLHEMIHVYFATKGMFKENHGFRFMAMLRKISELSGIRIPTEESTANLQLVNEVTKPCAVLVVKGRGASKYSFMIMSVKTAQENSELLKSMWATRLVSSASLYLITTPIWSKMALRYPVARKISGSLYFLNEMDAAEDLYEHGKQLWHIEPKGVG